MLATYLFGRLAARSKPSLTFLHGQVGRDEDWRVQEILAQAFDQYCRDAGYEKALPIIEAWLSDPNPNVRRAASEGPRIWTARPYFREHPGHAIRLLSRLRADESEYVRKSAGNALRDISRKHADLVRAELGNWDLSDSKVRQTHQLAGRFLK
jgi:3-methyladenine DNA glycosylase AlkC